MADFTQGFIIFSQDLSRYNWVASNFHSDNAQAASFNCTYYYLFGLV